ncbi:MAG: magnesium transporter [Anaerolineae bacterium]|nr:magnesium transporter [Anaerolineae bacterium]
MEANLVDNMLLQVRYLLEHDDIDAAIRLIEGLMPPDQADLFEELAPDQQELLLPQLETEDAADIFEELEDEDAAELATRIDVADLAQIVEEMEPDEAADLLGDLEPSLSSAMLAQLQDPEEVRPLLLHPDETAGGLMTSQYLVFRRNMRAGQVLAALREWMPTGKESVYLFVVDEEEHLFGVASLFDVLRSDPSTRLGSLVDTEVLSVRVSDDQETAARLMARYDLVAVPVVDDLDHLVGVITVDDLVDVLEEEATEDILRISGSGPLSRTYLEAGVLAVAWRRLGWLMLLFVTGTLTGTVMRLFQDTLAQLVVLSVFVPLLIGTGGNAGSQTTATVIRAIATGDISFRDGWRVLWHELRTSLVLGLLLSIIAYVRAATWGNSTALSLVVASSIFAIVIWADCVGALLPLLAAKLKIDPALVSGPLMSTLVDATGLLIYFSIARLALGA